MIKMLKLPFCFIFLLLVQVQVFAQVNSFKLTSLPLEDLSSFKNPGKNWTLAGAIQAMYTDTVLKQGPGTGVLVNNISSGNQGTNLFTNLDHGDIYLELDYNLPKGSNSGVYFQSRYEIQLFDSWGVQYPRIFDNGAIYERWDESRAVKGFEGHPPFKNASFAPGLWQHLEVLFQAPRFDQSGKKISDARFLFVRLNGITIHENIILHGPTRAAAFNDEVASAPLMIQGDHGMVALRNIKYAPQNELKVSLTDISYKYYEGNFDTETKAFASKPSREGKTEFIDSRLAEIRDGYTLVFEGKLQVPEQDTYSFTALFSGEGGMEIDGKTVIAKKWTWIYADALTGSAELSPGTHTLRLWYNKQVGWTPPGLSLFVQKPNSKSVALHTPASMPERRQPPLIEVQSFKTPEIVRSFQFRDTKKLTHVISVGSPQGVHYSYDLLQGALLQSWKGNFLNVTDMWYERGEPQTSEPMGAPIIVSGLCPVIDDPANITDSVAGYQYKGYRLNPEGFPIFQYQHNGVKIEDLFLPWENNKGLMRNLSVSGTGSEKKHIRIAEGKSVAALGNGLYSIDQQKYYVKIISANAAQAKMISSGGMQILTIPAGSGAVQYALIW